MSEAPTFFVKPSEFRAWLAKQHAVEDELWVGYYKKATGKPSLTWEESVDEALCHGWIDGIRKSIDEESYKIRFTPRKKSSHWSKKNIESAERLIAEGRMKAAGRKAFEARAGEKSGAYAYEQEQILELSPDYLKKLKANKAAWEFFQEQPPGYRKTVTHWIMSAKREETRQRRLASLIEDSANQLRIKQLRRS